MKAILTIGVIASVKKFVFCARNEAFIIINLLKIMRELKLIFRIAIAQYVQVSNYNRVTVPY